MAISCLRQIGYQLLGYKKIPLRDTKKVLTKRNNFKLERITKGPERGTKIINTILPSGTKVETWRSTAYGRPSSQKFIYDIYGNKIYSWKYKPTGEYLARIKKRGADEAEYLSAPSGSSF